MVVYGLTTKGIMIAKNPRNPNTLQFRIISYLYSSPKTLQQISDYIGVNPMQTSRIMRHLKGIVAEE